MRYNLTLRNNLSAVDHQKGPNYPRTGPAPWKMSRFIFYHHARYDRQKDQAYCSKGGLRMRKPSREALTKRIWFDFSPFQHPSPLIFPVYKRKSPAFAGLFRQTGASKRVPFFHFCRPCTAHSASALFVSRILNWHFDLQDAWIWALYSPSTGLPTMYTQP